MAAIPKDLAEEGRPSSSSSRNAPTSHGRGGAGNIGTSKTDFDPVALETPTIKSQIYTTGRGGSGNMAKNNDAEEARRAQDVTGVPRHESNNNQHIGRGGEGNVFKPSKEELDAAKKDGKQESAVDDHHHHKEGKGEEKGIKGLAEKGREFLFGKK